MIDLEAEYLAALADTSPKRRRELQDLGVTAHALRLAGPAFVRVRPVQPALFEPDPDSEVSAFVVPVRALYPDTPEAPDPDEAVFSGHIVDLVAFDPVLTSRWRLRTGTAEWLGACPPQYLDPPPVMLHRTPLDWLRASCEGLVCLARAPLEILRFLLRFARIMVDNIAHAAELRALLARPFLSPTILVRES